MSEISKTSSSLSFRAYKAQSACLVSAPSPHADGFHLSPLQGHPLPLHASTHHSTELRPGWEGRGSRTHPVAARLLLPLCRTLEGGCAPQLGAALGLGLLPDAAPGPSSWGHLASGIPLSVLPLPRGTARTQEMGAPLPSDPLTSSLPSPLCLSLPPVLYSGEGETLPSF